MTFKLNSFFQHFEGEWLSQESIYLLKSKKQKINNNTIKIFRRKMNLVILNKANLFYTYNLDILLDRFPDNTCSSLLHNKASVPSKFSVDINFKLICYNLLKTSCTIMEKKLVYEEYLYSINSNFKISVGILKKLGYKKYLGISTASYIKVQ